MGVQIRIGPLEEYVNSIINIFIFAYRTQKICITASSNLDKGGCVRLTTAIKLCHNSNMDSEKKIFRDHARAFLTTSSTIAVTSKGLLRHSSL